MSAEIKEFQGTPTLFLDGKPVFYGLMWGSPPAPDGYALKECARYYAEAGIHLFTFDMGTGGSPADWSGPRKEKLSPYDFDHLESRFKQVIKIDPLARFHLRIQLEMPEWWQKLYPEECEIAADGRHLTQSFASKVWQQQAKDYLRALISHIHEIGMEERIIAYQTGAGHTGEWVKAASAMQLTCGDFSLPMQVHFREWLLEHYRDESALRAAWNDPDITFSTVEVPPAEAQFSTRQFTLRSPAKEQNVIDYYKCLADLCANLIIDFCSTVKEASNRKALAGAFYGYLMELAWNSGFFAEGVDSIFSTYQRSGHLGLARVLQSPNVDFLVSPYSYGFRGIGGDGPGMLPMGSVKIHEKIYIYEDDTRTHICWQGHPNFGKVDTLEETLAILKRNFAYVVTHGHGIWWLGGGGPKTPHIELSQQPAFRPLIKRFAEIGQLALELDREPCAEIAVLLDDESFFYEWLRNDLDIPLIFQQRLWGLPRVGAPFDTYLLNDFIEGKLKPYKLYIFLNAFHLDEKRRQGLKSELRKDGRVAVWIYAPGYLETKAGVEGMSLENMSDLTGFRFGKGEHPWGPQMNLLDFGHPITAGLKEDMVWGTNSLLGPVFHLEDDGARVLGNVVYSEGRCRPGLGVKEYTEWKSIYSAVPNLPAWILRGMARYAGVHLYSEAGDVLYATKELLGVHTAGGGKRLYRLPEEVEVVYDLYEQREVAREVNQFRVELEPASTRLFYTGRRLIGM
jgi:hypothetical protein